MASEVPEDSTEFNELMLEVDHHLASSGFGIPQRPVNALGEISRKFSIPLPITKPLPGFDHELAAFWHISARIYDWYDRRYGERIKIDFSPGKMAILIEDDVWVLRFPRIFGSVSLTVSRTIESDRLRSDGKPAVYNVVDAVENLPRSRIAVLPDKELEHIYEKFLLGLNAFGVLEGSAEHDLVHSAVADVAAAVEHLTGAQPQYGLSKWSSLQAAEKMLKAAITLSGGTYSNTHSLEKLGRQAEAAGLTNRWSVLTPHIQCSPGIRYGDEGCDRDTALLAHHASLALIIFLQEGGAVFQSNSTL